MWAALWKTAANVAVALALATLGFVGGILYAGSACQANCDHEELSITNSNVTMCVYPSDHGQFSNSTPCNRLDNTT